MAWAAGMGTACMACHVMALHACCPPWHVAPVASRAPPCHATHALAAHQSPAGPSGSCVREICRTTGTDIKSWTADPDGQCSRSCRVFRWVCAVWDGRAAGEGMAWDGVAWRGHGMAWRGVAWHGMACGRPPHSPCCPVGRVASWIAGWGSSASCMASCHGSLRGTAHSLHTSHVLPCLAAGSRARARAWRPRWASCATPWPATRSCARGPTQVGLGRALRV